MTSHQQLSPRSPQTLEFYDTTETKVIPWNLVLLHDITPLLADEEKKS